MIRRPPKKIKIKIYEFHMLNPEVYRANKILILCRVKERTKIRGCLKIKNKKIQKRETDSLSVISEIVYLKHELWGFKIFVLFSEVLGVVHLRYTKPLF